MNLYQTTQLAQLQNFIDEDGVIDMDGFKNAELALADKQLAVICYLRNETGNIDMVINAGNELIKRGKAMQSRYDSLKDYLLVNMQASGTNEITEPNLRFSAKLQNNPSSVVIDDESLVPPDYFVQPDTPPPAISKALIKQAITDGYVVAGAHLEQKQRLVIK
jgi:hypothetical protein